MAGESGGDVEVAVSERRDLNFCDLRGWLEADEFRPGDEVCGRGDGGDPANQHLLIDQQSDPGNRADEQSLDHTKTSRPARHFGTTKGRPPTRRGPLTRGPDPLHLAVVFGLDGKTAIRYANATRQLL